VSQPFPTARLLQELRAALWLALPIVAGQLLTVAMNVIDTALAGHLGTDVLAAVAMGYQTWIIAFLVVLGVTLAVTPSVALLDGAGLRHTVGAVFRQGLWMALGLGTLLLLAVRHADVVLEYAGVAAEIRPGAGEFLRAISWGAPAIAIYFVCKNTSEGLSMTRPTMYFGVLGVVLLAPLAWAMMYGRLGFPAMGAAGAGAAHAIVLWAQALAFLLYLKLRRAHYGSARLFDRRDGPQWRAIVDLLRTGVPMGVSIFMEGSLFVAAALLAGSFGPVAASAHAIAISIASTAFMLPLGIAMATTIRVGNALGRRDADGVAWAATASLVLTVVTQVVSVIVMIAFAGPIAGLYTRDAAVAALAVTLIGYAAIFQIPDGIQALANGSLRGLRDTTIPAIVTIVAYWGAGFGVAWWLGVHLDQGPAGLWTGLIVGLSVAALALTTRFVQHAQRLRRAGFVAR
jgi:multidrug resistance protein, MATE family